MREQNVMQRLAGFVTSFRREALADGRTLPFSTTRLAAVLLTDVVGFTAMGDEAVRQGVIGAEKLAETINHWLGGIFRTITMWGGEVYIVAGDAILAVWFADDRLCDADAVTAAVQAGLSIHGGGNGSRFGTSLSVRSSVVFGPVRHSELGGWEEEWHGVLTGLVLTNLGALNRQAEPNCIVASDAAWRLLAGRGRGTRLAGGAYRITAVSGSPPYFAKPPSHEVIPPRRLGAAVPRMVVDWIEADLEITRVGQFRTVTAVFILLEGTEPGTEIPANLLQQAVLAAQRASSDFQGSVYQVLGDEQGVSIVLAYGLPPFSHEDDAARAVRAALLLQHALAEVGLKPSLGIATGRAFCCVYGDDDRRQFALVSPVMNLAARLMQARQGLVCDADTIQAVRRHHHLNVRELAPLPLKGKELPVTCYAPLEAPIRADVTAERMDGGAVVGRTAELALFDRALAALQSGRGGTVVIEGEPGIGKTAIVVRALAAARARNVRTVTGFSDAIEESTSYFPWRPIFVEVFGVESLPPFEIPERVRWRLGSDAQLAPLLNPLLSLRLEETPETMRLSAVTRAETTRRILLEQLARYVGETPTFLVLEDLHWFDSASWTLLNAVADADLPVLLAATTRPFKAAADAYSRLLNPPRCEHFVLGGIAEEQTSTVLARALGVERSAPDVAAFVQARTAGNPFFVGELAKVLHNAGTVRVIGNQVVMSADVLLAGSDLDAVLQTRGIPATLEGTIVARLDRLPRRRQLVIRAASAVGRTFDLATLSAALSGDAAATLADDIEALVGDGLIAPASDNGYTFCHVLLRDVAYHGMSFSERRLLHRSLAQWMEQTPEGRAGLLDTLLGHHFREAGETEAAVRYLARSGRAAVNSYSNKEAASLLASAIALQEGAVGAAVDRREQGALRLLLGRAYLALSHNPESRRSSEAGLALVDTAVPSSGPHLAARVVGEIARQVGYRAGAGPDRPANGGQRNLLSGAAIALEGLAEIYFYEGDALRSLYASLRMLNLAERLGPSAELARSYAAVSGITGLLGLRTTAAFYRRRSQELLADIDDPGAAAWALNLLGVSRTGTGDWQEATSFFQRTGTIARPLGERRREMDALDGCAIVSACRGDWLAASRDIEEMRLLAARDADQRYLLLAYRTQAFVELQTGRFDEVARTLVLIKAEIDRGLKVEEAVTRQDYHAFAGTLALESGDLLHSGTQADAGLAVAMKLSGTGSYANRYWTMLLIGRIYLHLWRQTAEPGSDREALARKAAIVHRLLKRLASAHPISSPAALLIGGATDWLHGRLRRAQRRWTRAAAAAAALDMRYEAALARREILRCHNEDRSVTASLDGLPLLDRMSSPQFGTAVLER